MPGAIVGVETTGGSRLEVCVRDEAELRVSATIIPHH